METLQNAISLQTIFPRAGKHRRFVDMLSSVGHIAQLYIIPRLQLIASQNNEAAVNKQQILTSKQHSVLIHNCLPRPPFLNFSELYGFVTRAPSKCLWW